MNSTTTTAATSTGATAFDDDLHDFDLAPRRKPRTKKTDLIVDDLDMDLDDFDLKPRKKNCYKRKFELSSDEDDALLRKDSDGSFILEPRQVNCFLSFF